jgi:thioredoxin reductase (NADPH)
MNAEEKIYDCIIVGAGPGGLQAAIYLGRYNMDVLVLDRSGGRTRHAKHVENYLGHRTISGPELLYIGLEQARSFNVEIKRETVKSILKKGEFEVSTDKGRHLGRFVIASSGVMDKAPRVEGLHRFFGNSIFTCVDCDGYRTTGKKLLVIGNHINAVRLAMAMRRMYTKDIALLLLQYEPPEDYKEELSGEGIPLIKGRPIRVLGEERLEGVELEDGRSIECESIMFNFGFRLNDGFLSGLPLKKDAKGFKYKVNHNFESSVSGLYIVGPLNTGNDQIVIAAGEGAVAAIDIKKRILELEL